MDPKLNMIVFYGKASILGSSDSALKRAGLEPLYAEDDKEVYEILKTKKTSALVIDIDDVGENGFELVRQVKEDLDTRNVALMVISNKEDEENMIRGLELGADDYVINPRSGREVLARVQAIIRRVNKSSHKVRVKDIEIDLDEHKVRKSGKPVDLTYIQFKLLYLLASRKNSVFSRQEILERVWGRKVYVTNRTVDVHIKRLREKLGEYKYPSQYIETIHGTGYRFLQ